MGHHLRALGTRLSKVNNNQVSCAPKLHRRVDKGDATTAARHVQHMDHLHRWILIRGA
jgi:hypothetical protein